MQITLRELREAFSDSLAKKLDNGEALWHDSRLTPYMPQSLASGKNFNGINALIFMQEEIKNGYGDPRWAVQNPSLYLKRGAKGIWAEWWERDDKNGLEFRSVLCFNACQLYNYPEMNEELLFPDFASARRILSGVGEHPPRPVGAEIHGTVLEEIDEQSGKMNVFYAREWHDSMRKAVKKTREENLSIWDPAYFGHKDCLELLRMDLALSFLTLSLGMGTPEADKTLPLALWAAAVRNDPSETARAARDAQKLTSKALSFGQTTVYEEDGGSK